jgi:hypothetical protein
MKKDEYFEIIECYVNDVKKKLIEEIYGKGTKVKIKNIDEIISKKSILIEAVVVLGEIINEEVMDESLADILIQDAVSFVHPFTPVKVIISWDV